MTEATFSEYLGWIHSLVGEMKIHILIYHHGSHFGPTVSKQIRDLGIIPILIPKGGTSKCQPLDRGIFGIMKRHDVAKWTSTFHENPNIKWTKTTAAEIDLECWESITA